MKNGILKAVEEGIKVKEKFFKENVDMIVEVVYLITDVFNTGKKLILFGNGGSATDASHIAAEFVNRFQKERPGLPAIALNTDMAIITSIANDYEYSDVFARQLKAIGNEGDIVIAISTSGNSPNVLKAADVARRKKMKIIAFTGNTGGKLASKVDYAFLVPSDSTPRIQETHITLGHLICQMVEESLFGRHRREK
ncbi:MAG: D-sedoheptulose 7-phosphate isomerase [Nitrospirota bacterium]